MLIDSHVNLHAPQFDADREAVISRALASGVRLMVNICDRVSNYDAVRLVAQHPDIWCTVGTHPHEAKEDPDLSAETLVALASDPRILGIGETGLDYYRLEGRSIADMEWQRERFRTHIRAAHATAKPLIIHTRSSWEDTLRIMAEERASVPGGVMHCFTEPWHVAEAALAQDFYISLSGIVTFKSAKEVQDVARRVPLERLLIETDSPYLAPVPYRGKSNEPAYVSYVGRFIAQLREMPEDALAAATTSNFFTLFKIPQPAGH